MFSNKPQAYVEYDAVETVFFLQESEQQRGGVINLHVVSDSQRTVVVLVNTLPPLSFT